MKYLAAMSLSSAPLVADGGDNVIAGLCGTRQTCSKHGHCVVWSLPHMEQAVSKPIVVSYFAVFAMLVLAASLHLATPLVTAFFAYFALSQLAFWRRKWVAICAFLLFVVA